MNEIGMLVGATPNSPSNNKTRERSKLRVPTSTATNKYSKRAAGNARLYINVTESKQTGISSVGMAQAECALGFEFNSHFHEDIG